MELWACGFNAWGQLEVDKSQVHSSPAQDLPSFKCVLRDPLIQFIRGSVTATLSKFNSRFYAFRVYSGVLLSSTIPRTIPSLNAQQDNQYELFCRAFPPVTC